MLTIKEKNNQLLVTISDNGKGFDTNSVHNGIGITNMKERVKLIEAELLIHCITNKNTTIQVILNKK